MFDSHRRNTQLTNIASSAVSGSSLNITYNYSSTQNNGKLTSQTDNISGEQVVYAYDALNRLASAGATNNSWGQSYAYDGFGNLTDQTVTAGTAPSLHVVYDATHNRQSGECADANGNIGGGSCGTYGYDVENRITSAAGMTYAYAPGNKRVLRFAWTSGSGYNVTTTNEITFWSVAGQKLATFNLTGNAFQNNNGSETYSLGAQISAQNAYFGGRLVANNKGNVLQDRLGSGGKFYPWGQEKPSATTNGTEKFTGYFRDAETNLDYAKNRYHQPGMGRFLSPDPYTSSAGPTDPRTWNRYAYAAGDPINFNDPMGLATCNVSGTTSGYNDPNDASDPVETVQISCTSQAGSLLSVSNVVFNGGATPSQIAAALTDAGNSIDAIEHTNFLAVLNQARQDLLQSGRITDDCAHALGAKSASDAVEMLGDADIGLYSDGAFKVTTNAAGYITGAAPGQSWAQNPGGDTLQFNSWIDWSSPGVTFAIDQHGTSVIWDVVSAEAFRVGAASMTPDQFVELTMLHELAHSFGKKHSPTDADAFNTDIWKNCFK